MFEALVTSPPPEECDATCDYKNKHPEAHHQHPSEVLDGFHLIFHDPFEIPSRHSAHYYTMTNQTLNFLILPELVLHDESIEGDSLEDRNCYLENERQLKYFKVYNQPNCEHECLSDLMSSTCGCTKFFIVRNNSTRICGLSDSICFNKVDAKFLDYFLPSCNCLKNCKTLKYNIEKQSVNYEP